MTQHESKPAAKESPKPATQARQQPEPVPTPPVAAAGFCKPSDRAANGLRRFKIRGSVPWQVHPTKYVAAASQGDAEAAYVKGLGLEKAAESTHPATKEKLLQLVVTALAD